MVYYEKTNILFGGIYYGNIKDYIVNLDGFINTNRNRMYDIRVRSYEIIY